MKNKQIIASLILLLLSGCTSLSLEGAHTSHPFAGPPFGPKSEEDSLNSVNACAQREKGRYYLEQCVGYKIGDGGFFGPRLIYTARAGVRWRIGGEK